MWSRKQADSPESSYQQLFCHVLLLTSDPCAAFSSILQFFLPAPAVRQQVIGWHPAHFVFLFFGDTTRPALTLTLTSVFASPNPQAVFLPAPIHGGLAFSRVFVLLLFGKESLTDLVQSETATDTD